MFNKLRKKLGLRQTGSVHEYGLLFFEHLHCDYRLVESRITDPHDKQILTEIIEKRNNGQLMWEDIRTFDLIVLKYQDFQTIKGKLESLRKRFEGVLSTTEIEQFKASPKLDLNNVTEAQIEEMRAEYSSLIREFCLRYSFMASREGFRSLLLRSGAGLTIVFCLIVILVGFIVFQYNPNVTAESTGVMKKALDTSLRNLFAFATLLMVVFAGITGAFVSMQQRIQSVTYKGDPIADLSVLTHGWLSIFLSPLSGAIFAVILYLFFAGQILSGTIFPEFVGLPENSSLDITANVKTVVEPTSEASPTVTPQDSQDKPVNTNPANQANVNGNSPKNQTNTSTGNTNSGNSSSTATNQTAQPDTTASANSNTTTNNPTQTSEISNNNVSQPVPIHLVDFLVTTGPKASKDFAMLLIWCFIAGFAERFVPDALNRLVSRQSETENRNATS